ncbi:4'-phosphopantetheinyl transferase family protein [Paenibacillus humicola]|uniref:4'-phosphopantetheinyl transferase family protein n=1 Tax=Paenibacillus humicola TaxID=3110540 RepID=UPI00237A56CB|nr:4'-phosphopantetheinyl transferase superfamily protein [Paenibacillus humicola]
MSEIKTESILNIYWVRLPEEIDLSAWESRLGLLNKEERTVYDRYLTDQKKLEFLVGRLLLKSLIGRRLAIEPERVAFVKNPYGKLYLHPKFNNETGNEPIYFNLSHSKRIVACVISSLEEAGIDVESMSPSPPLDVMPVVFVHSERNLIEAESSLAKKREAFYTVWTRKEAVMKAVGKGFSHPPLSFSVPVYDERAADEYYLYYTFRPVNDEIISIAASRKAGIEIKIECREVHDLEAF